MAKQIIRKLIDDIDGGDADETVRFSMDGVQYEIDLSEKNAAELRDIFAPYIKAGSRVGRQHWATRPRDEGGPTRQERKLIRAWAEANGHEVADRGRIAKRVVDAYYAAVH